MSMRGVGPSCLLMFLLVFVTAPSNAFGAPWSTPASVSSPALFVSNAFIGFDHAGVGLASWRWQEGVGANARSGVRLATQTVSGSFTPERAVPAPLSVPAIYGGGHVFWKGEEGVVRRRRQLTRVKIAFGLTDGAIGKPRTLYTAETFRGPVSDVNNAGQIALAYIHTTRGRQRTARLFVGRGRRLGQSRVVSRRGDVNAVTVAVGPRGDIVVAWERRGRIEARIRRPGHRLGRVIPVGRGARLGTGLRAAVASTGRVWLAWASQSLSEGGDNGPFELQTAASSSTRFSFRRPRILDRYDRLASDEATFDLSLDPERKGLVAWSSFDGQNFRARLASFNRTGRSARFTTLSLPGYDATVSDLATSEQENEALVVWSRLDAVGEVGTMVLAGYLSPTGDYSGEEQVSTGDRARAPAVAFNPRTGRPTAVWSQREGPDAPGVPLQQIRTFLRASSR
jgi:hypothetical protein